jgi:hypothetical protein
VTPKATAPAEPVKWTAADILERLRGRHAGNDWAFFAEVPDATGLEKSRTLDALAVSLWPSRGLELHGFEIKVSRSDWLRELAEPAKADSFFGFLDRFAIAAPPGVVKPEELPTGWGLAVARGDSIAYVAPAAKLSPRPISREFFAALCRTATTASASAEAIRVAVRDAENRERERLARMNEEALERDRRHRGAELEKLRAAVTDFETKTGIPLARWGGASDDAVAAVKIAATLGRVDLEAKVRNTREILGRALKSLEGIGTEGL